MLIKNYQITFLIFLISGTMITASANSWFTCWLGLEINLMGFIPLILSNLNSSTTEAAIKYFLVQAMASVLLIFFSAFEALSINSIFNSNSNSIIFIALATKAGLAPFHFWFPQIMLNISWAQCVLVLVWQKIAPFILMSYFSNKMTIYFVVVLSAMVGALGGLNQIFIKMILTYSSIAHSSWMLMLSSLSNLYWVNYFFIYSTISISLIIPFFLWGIDTFSNSKNLKMEVPMKMNMTFSTLSLGGLPPFLGFYAKLTAIKVSIFFTPIFIMATLIFSSLISLFYYMKMIYSFLFSTNTEMILSETKTLNSMNMFMIMSSAGNLFIPLLVLLT